MNETVPTKARVGRPPKPKAPIATPVAKVAPRHKMKAKPNWEEVTDDAFEGTPDKLHIPKEMIPEGMDLQWVTDSIWGQPMSQHRAQFEKRGWTPVHQEDFDGIFNGIWMPKNAEGEIKCESVVLMARPIELSRKAKAQDRRLANEKIQIKERALRGGELPGVTLDGQHPTAVNSNRISKSFERISIPEDK